MVGSRALREFGVDSQKWTDNTYLPPMGGKTSQGKEGRIPREEGVGGSLFHVKELRKMSPGIHCQDSPYREEEGSTS